MSKSSIRINGVIGNGELRIAPAMNEAKKRWLAGQKDGTQIGIELKRPSIPKSKQQLGAVFGLLLKTAIIEMHDLGMDTSYIYKLDKPTGIAIDSDSLLEYMYNACPIFRNDERITLSKMDMAEIAKCYDDFCKYLASQFGIVIPETDPDWRKTREKLRDKKIAEAGGVAYPSYKMNGEWKK